jgi:hypothetical protein
LTEEEAAALVRELRETVKSDRRPFSRRVVALRAILAKLRPETVRERRGPVAPPRDYEPPSRGDTEGEGEIAMPASPESSPPDFNPSRYRYTDDDLHAIVRSGNQNPKVVGSALAELERRRNAREDARFYQLGRRVVWTAVTAGLAALGAIVTAIVSVIRLIFIDLRK